MLDAKGLAVKVKSDDGRWLVGVFLPEPGNDSGFYIVPEGEEWRDGMPPLYQVRPDTVRRFTGCRDKDGHRIFEEDMIEYNNRGIYRARVKWDNGFWRLGWLPDENGKHVQLRTDLLFWAAEREIGIVKTEKDKSGDV